ncbi:hypothetical protein K3719_14530 [Leisingera aquaemixtae]|nr:hypothetical protein K3719_14530 [Leisingera aquaemixtae]
MESAVGMERDLSHAMSWDPAMSGFAEEAESCWQECLRLAGDVLAAAPASASDQPLQRMSMLLHFLIESTSADEALRFQHLLESNHELFTAEDSVRQAALRTAARQVNTLADLALSAAAKDCHPG